MQSELATIKLQELLSLTQKTLQDIKQIAVCVGPGSFTGIRVGLNLARTLAYGLDLRLANFTTLELLAFKLLKPGDQGRIALKSVQNYYFVADYDWTAPQLKETAAPLSKTEDELTINLQPSTKVLIEGESTGFSACFSTGFQTQPSAKDLIDWLVQWPESKHFFSWNEIKPLYIRASEAEEKMRKGLLKPLT